MHFLWLQYMLFCSNFFIPIGNFHITKMQFVVKNLPVPVIHFQFHYFIGNTYTNIYMYTLIRLIRILQLPSEIYISSI